MTMRLTVNGAPTDVDPEVTVAALVATLTDQQRRVAVAVNGEVLSPETQTVYVVCAA